MHQQLGKALLVRSVSLAAVGPYELGLRVSTASSTFAQLVLAAMIPEASVLHAQADAERLRELHGRAGRLVTAATAAVTAALVAAAPAPFAAWLPLFIAAGIGSLACAAALVATHYVPWHEIEQLFDRGTAA